MSRRRTRAGQQLRLALRRRPAIAGPKGEGALSQVDGLDGCPLRGDEGTVTARCQSDHLVARPVVLPIGVVSSGPVSRPLRAIHPLPARSARPRSPAARRRGRSHCRPRRQPPRRRRRTGRASSRSGTACTRSLARTSRRLCRPRPPAAPPAPRVLGVDLAAVLAEGMDGARVAGDQGAERTARADRARAGGRRRGRRAWPRRLRRGRPTDRSTSSVMPASSRTTRLRSVELELVVVEPPGEAGEGARLADARLLAQGARRLARRRRPHHVVAGTLEGVGHHPEHRGLARAGHAHDQLGPGPEVQIASAAARWPSVSAPPSSCSALLRRLGHRTWPDCGCVGRASWRPKLSAIARSWASTLARE